jgi:hypothetical protein
VLQCAPLRLNLFKLKGAQGSTRSNAQQSLLFLGAERSLTLTTSKMKGAQGSARSNTQQRATVWEHGARERSLTLTNCKMKGAQESVRSLALPFHYSLGARSTGAQPNSDHFQDDGSARAHAPMSRNARYFEMLRDRDFLLLKFGNSPC